MRKIKFRGKRLDNGKWVYGAYVNCGNWNHIFTQGKTGALDAHRIDPATVGQYTGLNDKHGREIYERDVVVIPGQYIWFDDGKPNYRGVVKWIYSQWQVIAHCVNPAKKGISDGISKGLNDYVWNEGRSTVWEVIGNIYDNPSLVVTKHE